jgi:hypothetical protein
MPTFINVADFLKIGILAFVFVFVANRILEKTGLGQFKA